MPLNHPTLFVLVVWEKVTGNRMIEGVDERAEKNGPD